MPAYESLEEAKAVLQRLLDLIKGDQAFKEGTRGTELTIAFELIDFDLVLCLSFINGEIGGFLGEPEEEPMVTLSMDSEILDGLFSGETDGASAAMNGDLSFSGDVHAAMGLQNLMDDFIRLYTLARSN